MTDKNPAQETGTSRNHKKHKHTLLLTCILIILAVLAGIQVFSVSFNQNPSISPSTAYTTSDLNCSWKPSSDTTQVNVSWYRDGVLFSNTTNIAQNYSALPSENTSKNEDWSCNVTLSNGTSTLSKGVTRSIRNIAPDEPNVYNNSDQDIGSFESIDEDQSYNYDINATDPDNDTLTYRVSPVASFCTVTDSSAGTVVCSPTSSDLGANNTAGQENITFWADDTDPYFPTSKGHTVLFNISPVNDAPEFSPVLSNQTMNESQVFNYEVSATDEENNTPLNFSISTSPALSLIINSTGNTSAIIMFENNRTATYSEAGNYTVNVTVNDTLNASTTSSFNLEIRQVNAEPVLENITTQNSTQGLSLTFYVYAHDTDVNDTLNFTISTTGCSISNPWNISTTNSSHNATGLVNISNLTNNHVICRDVRITVIDDVGAEDFQDVFLNISNANDPPIVQVLSSHSNNTGGNNISNLTAYAESPFTYIVNATDIDSDTYEGEMLSYSDNSTLFNITNQSGIISFTPSQNQTGNHTFNITVTDDEGLSHNRIMSLEIINNSRPVLSGIDNFSCAEDTQCLLVINATDADNDNLSFWSNNTQIFNLTDNTSQSPVTSAYVNYTPNQSMVGNHSILIIVNDTRGASSNATIILTINNTNDAPVLQSFSFPKVVETHSVSIYVHAADQDYDLGAEYATINASGVNTSEYVTFNDTNLSGADLFDISTIFNTSNNQTYARILFTPSLGTAGNYAVNITAKDYTGATDWVEKNFTIHNKTQAPNITRIQPYGRPVSSSAVFSFTNTSLFNGSTSTEINFSENRSVLYNITVTDDTTADENLSYAWYVNGSLNSTNSWLNLSYDFFSSGSYNITVIVSDDTYENSSWTWNITVDDLNRAPLFLNDLNNMSINSTTVYTDYLKKTTGVHFIDPDDDLNSNNDFDTGENSSLNYSVTSCDVANITFEDDSVRVVPDSVGTCTVSFTATDFGSLSNTSNVVVINVTNVPNATDVIENPEPSTGGGGGRTSSVIVPITTEEEEPKAIEIVVPEIVTVYKNKTVLIPVTIKNNWNNSLMEVQLNATTNASEIKMSFTQDYFDELSVGEKRNVTLMIDNYRLGENYEVKITANVTTPKASDSALVLLNSIEQADEGEDVETKVTFAQDLLNDNPECLELNELLKQAVKEMETGSREEASKMVDSVINGCKYLVSVSRQSQQQPQSIASRFLKKENLKYLLIFAGVVAVVLITVLVLKKVKASRIRSAEEEKKKVEQSEHEIRPYWP